MPFNEAETWKKKECVTPRPLTALSLKHQYVTVHFRIIRRTFNLSAKVKCHPCLPPPHVPPKSTSRVEMQTIERKKPVAVISIFRIIFWFVHNPTDSLDNWNTWNYEEVFIFAQCFASHVSTFAFTMYYVLPFFIVSNICIFQYVLMQRKSQGRTINLFSVIHFKKI